MTATTHIGAIDAGSNALRIVVAEVTYDGAEPRRLAEQRVPVRLGHGAFTVGELDTHVVDEAVSAFKQFRDLFARYDVQHYRAVTTSAVRSARNRDVLLHRINAEAGIELEVITGEEEARLTRKAVRNAFRNRPSPLTVLDLGGGSLEVNFRRGKRWSAASLPIGTVRLAETFGMYGTIGEEEARMVRRYVTTLLQVLSPNRDGLQHEPAAACGGNVERFAKLLCPQPVGMPSIEMAKLNQVLPAILAADVPTRMARWNVTRDRAEVMGVAGLVLATCAQELGISELHAPGVGIRDALLFEIAAALPERRERAESARSKALVTSARMFAARVGHDATHGEHVRHLALQLFDQLVGVHRLPLALRPILEIASVLHDIGEVLSPQRHQQHGEYMILNGRIHGLESPAREMVAALVRAHRKSAPRREHPGFATLDAKQRRHVSRLLALLRMADALDSEHRQRVRDIETKLTSRYLDITLLMRSPGAFDTADALRKSARLERMLGRKVRCSVAP